MDDFEFGESASSWIASKSVAAHSRAKVRQRHRGPPRGGQRGSLITIVTGPPVPD